MKYTLESIDPNEPALTVETWTHPIREITYVDIELTPWWDFNSRSMRPEEARELAQALNNAADEAEAAQA